MNARVCRAVLGGVFLKARSRHERAKEKIPEESRGIQRAGMWHVGKCLRGNRSVFSQRLSGNKAFIKEDLRSYTWQG